MKGKHSNQGNEASGRPLVLVSTRYLTHFRYGVFRRLMDELSEEFEVVFAHDINVPDHDTGISGGLLPTSHRSPMRFLIGHFHIQPETIRLVRQRRPAVFVVEASPYSLTVHCCGLIQRLCGRSSVYWTKGPSPKQRSGLRRRMTGLAFRVWSSLATVLVGYGQTTKQWFLECGKRDEDIVIAQNTIDTSEILGHEKEWYERGVTLRHELGLADRFVIGTVSRLTRPKRVDLIIRAAGRLAAEADTPLGLLIGGAGPERERLEALASEQDGLDVRFLGKLPVGEDNTVFAAADVNVFAGAIGLAVIQSMALQRLTICADEPFADAELVLDEQTGLRFTRGSEDELVHVLRRAMSGSDIIGRIVQAGRDHVIAHATIENMVQQLATAIRIAASRVRNLPTTTPLNGATT